MWYPLNSNPPNTYLRMKVNNVKPRILNRAVDSVLQRISTGYDLEPPFQRLDSASPCVLGPNLDVTKSRLAFGRWAMPKLKRELHDEDPEVVRQAVTSLMEVVHDPEKTFEAVRWGVVDRLIDLLVHVDPLVRERCCMVLTTISGQAAGRQAIIHQESAVMNLNHLVEDESEDVRHKAALTIEMICRDPLCVMVLLRHGFVGRLLKNMVDEFNVITAVHLTTLRSLLERGDYGKLRALHLGAMDIMLTLADDVICDVSAGGLANMAALLTHPKGRKMADKLDVMQLLANKLEHEDNRVHTQAAAALMFATITTPAKLRAVELFLSSRLVHLAGDFNSPDLQTFCLKTLTNMAHVPKARQVLLSTYQQQIIDLVCKLEYVDTHRHTLLEVMRWKP